MDGFIAFLLAFVVSLLCIPFSKVQGSRLTKAVLERSRGQSRRQRTAADLPETTEALVAQSLDIAYAFPSSILTIFAYYQFVSVPRLIAGLLIIVTVCVSLGLVWLLDPERIGVYLKFQVWRVSWITWILLILNLIGMVIEIPHFLSDLSRHD